MVHVVYIDYMNAGEKSMVDGKLTPVNSEPKSGQFVAVWMFNGLPWASTYRRVGNCLEEYDAASDEWVIREEGKESFFSPNGLQYTFFAVSK